MKKQLTVFTVLFGLTAAVFASGNALAAEKKGSSTTSSMESFRSSSSAPWGLGLTTTLNGMSGISGWIPFGEGMQGLQLGFGIQTTSPFTFALGAAYKSTLAGTRQTGFHIGGGIALGTGGNGLGGTQFNIGISGILGVHYSPVEAFQMSFDAGPTVTIAGGSASFGMGALSTLAGFTVMYMFY
ncbi:MAG: hypothetical protein AB7P04_12655 [Bacteriovoracia bacterium]